MDRNVEQIENEMSAVNNANVVTVTGLNEYIKSLLEGDGRLINITVKGEISNFKLHPSGHLYFSLKDNGGVVRAVMFKSSAQNVKFRPADGMKVLASGYISLYVQGGQYQLYVRSLEADGVGSLYAAFEALKLQLASEGLFAPEHKKKLPKIPSRVGVITSPTGAAVRDVINILGRRFPFAEVVLYPSLVQGNDAPASLISGLRYFNSTHSADVIIIGRGGGSIEDLWAFNNEALAREIYMSEIPVISAVGHETDFTICDFVADMRAPTPSAAAEIAVPERTELVKKMNNVVTYSESLLRRRTDRMRSALAALSDRRIFREPESMYDQKRMRIMMNTEKLEHLAKSKLLATRSDFAAVSKKLSALSPLDTIARGYSVAFCEDGAVIRSTSDVSLGERISVRVSDGSITAEVVDSIDGK